MGPPWFESTGRHCDRVKNEEIETISKQDWKNGQYGHTNDECEYNRRTPRGITVENEWQNSPRQPWLTPGVWDTEDCKGCSCSSLSKDKLYNRSVSWGAVIGAYRYELGLRILGLRRTYEYLCRAREKYRVYLCEGSGYSQSKQKQPYGWFTCACPHTRVKGLKGDGQRPEEVNLNRQLASPIINWKKRWSLRVWSSMSYTQRLGISHMMASWCR